MMCRIATCAAAAVALWPVPSPASVYPPDPGTDRESEAYFEAAETYLQNLDLNDPSLVFDRLGGTTATNWSVARDGVLVADLKCSSGNTDHHGAVVTYRLGRELGFNIYPVAVYRNVNRRIGDIQLDQQCALKEWDSVFTQYYWTRKTFEETDSRSKRELIDALQCGNPKPQPGDRFQFYARSAYGDPKIPGARRVRYLGDTSLLDAARDFSTMMAIDVLIGNEDRFPGGNAFFRSTSTSHVRDGDAIVFDDARLFSLDNEAAFKAASAASTHAARDLKNHVSRFDGDLMAKLQRLVADADALARITDGAQRLTAFIREGIQLVVDHHEEARAACGDVAASF